MQTGKHYQVPLLSISYRVRFFAPHLVKSFSQNTSYSPDTHNQHFLISQFYGHSSTPKEILIGNIHCFRPLDLSLPKISEPKLILTGKATRTGSIGRSSMKRIIACQ